MKSIFKFPLALTDVQRIQLPLGAQILTAQVQHGELVLWAMVGSEPSWPRTIRIFGTGHPIDDDLAAKLRYVATAQLHDGGLILHVFEELQ